MAESKHNHDHDHAGPAGCCGHEPAKPDGGPEFTDSAGEHLAAALKTSFRLLGAAMVLGVIAFLAVGFQSVKPGEVAILTVFGRVVDVRPEGLAYNWPAPIGQIEIINVGEQKVAVDDFWMREAPGEKIRDLRKRTVPPGGLSPGIDGALLTGDRNLVHMKLQCTYAITRTYELPWDAPELAGHPVIAFARRAADPSQTVAAATARAKAENADPVVISFLEKCDPARTLADVLNASRFASPVKPAMYYRLNIQDGKRTVQSALCDAAIQAAAVRTADGLQRTDRGAFERDAMNRAQAKLDELKSGIMVRSVKVTDSTWPIATLADYDAAQSAVQQAETLKSQAHSLAVTMLTATAGIESARKLVGQAGSYAADDANTDLIGQYQAAAARGDKAAAATLLGAIDRVLESETTIGAARAMLSAANVYRANTIEAVKRRVTDFEQRLAAYEANPAFAMNRWWNEAREEILSNPTAEKHYVTEAGPKIVLKLNRDSDIIRQTRRAWTEWLSGQKETSPPPSPTEPGK
jgi:regulator of protease activity HflC (stomatin/prohibitin superfamily)